MQQTEKYQLNLIETSDTFSPAPLNENAQKLEAALDAVTAHADAGDAALDQRVQALELHKFAYGTYTGNGKKSGDTQTIELGFTPAAVLVANALYVDGYPQGEFQIVPGGFMVRVNIQASGLTTGCNLGNILYRYIAFC